MNQFIVNSKLKLKNNIRLDDMRTSRAMELLYKYIYFEKGEVSTNGDLDMIIIRNVLIVIIVLLSCCLSVVNAKDIDHNYSQYSNLLKKYVGNGLVNYQDLKSNQMELEQFLTASGSILKKDFLLWSKDQQLAFLFNIYNASTLKLIINHYPLQSIKDIGGFFKGPWDQKIVKLFGETITLDKLEHQILRKQYAEPRLHVALVCAALACPHLRSEAYTAIKLNDQLNEQAKNMLADPLKFRIDKEGGVVYLSSIFKWYGDDFISEYSPVSGFDGLNKKEKAVVNYVMQYISDSDKAYLKNGNYDIEYLDYDWSLNEDVSIK